MELESLPQILPSKYNLRLIKMAKLQSSNYVAMPILLSLVALWDEE